MKPQPMFPLFASLIALLFTTGCARRETDVEAGIRTQTLLVGNASEPESLDPHIARSMTEARIFNALFEGLTVLDEESAQPVPGVAERWETSSDGLVFTFHLRADARWSNGDPVTAHDFAFAFRRILTPALGAHYAYMLWPLKNAEAFNRGAMADFSAVGVRVLDDRTLCLTLERPTAYLPALVSHMTWLPLHRPTLERCRAVSDRQAAWAVPGSLVGNGPFMLTAWRENVRVVAARNPHYWDAANTRLQSVVFIPTESSGVEERNFRAGQVHVTWALPRHRMGHYRQNNPASLRLDPFLNIAYLGFNTTRDPLTNPLVRRALSLAIDRPALTKGVLHDADRPAHRLTPPGMAGYAPSAAVPTDPAMARALLAEAGHSNGRGLHTLEILVSHPEPFPLVAQALQEHWRRELGIETTIAQKDWNALFDSAQLLNYDIAVLGWVADYADPINFIDIFHSAGGNNWTGWASADYDSLLATAAQEFDQCRRFEILGQAEALLLEQSPIAPLYFRASVYLLHPAVRGWTPAPMLVRRFQKVWLEP